MLRFHFAENNVVVGMTTINRKYLLTESVGMFGMRFALSKRKTPDKNWAETALSWTLNIKTLEIVKSNVFDYGPVRLM